MNYRDKLKDIKELDIDSDNLKQILDTCHIMVSPESAVAYIERSAANIIEELSKMYRLYESAIKISHINGSEQEIRDLLDGCNFQSGKVMYSFARLLSLSNIDYHSVKNYYDALLTEKKLKDSYFFDNQMLQTAIQFGRFNNIGDQIYNNPTINRRAINLPNEPDDDFCRAFRILNPVLLQLLSQDLWELTVSLSLALKEISDDKPDMPKFHSEVMESWLRFIKCMDMVGHTWLSIGRVFTVYNYSIYENNGTNK